MTAHTYRLAEGWLAGYWLLTSAILLFGPHFSTVGVQLALLQLGAAAALYILSRWCDRNPAGGWLYWIPWTPLFLWTYGNIDKVHKALGWPYQDAMIQGWEHKIWGSIDPARDFSLAWPWLWFSETIHFCYITYYAMLPLLLARMFYRDRDRPDLLRLVLSGPVSSLVCCYVINILIPVQGPRPLYPPLDPALHGPVWTFCHSVLKQAAAGAAAFPSGHTTYSVTTAILAWRWDRSWFPVYAIWAACVVSATVYGRFHYTVDVLAGLVLAVGCAGYVFFRDPDR